MEADRGAVLTLRAAVRGVIDFSQARVHDVRWWRRANVLIRAMAAEDDLVAVRAAFDLQRSLVGNAGLTEKSFEGCQKKAQALFGDIVECLYPWSVKDAAARTEGQMGSLIDAYKKMVGDPDDPEFQKKLLHDLTTLEAEQAAEPAESESDRIDRLLRERDEHYDRIRRGQVP